MEVTIGSKKYECGRFGLTELADLQDWMQGRREDKIIARARKVYGDELPDKIFDEISKEITLDDLDGAIASDVRSISYLIFLTIKKVNDSVTFKEVSDGIPDLESAMKILDGISPKATKKKVKRKPRK